ncbi:MAG: 2-(1,2-epoxy,2-dihydrophenyl)acetyl-CoA isomerase [Actinomycetota bacterium]|jgi:2-(1,2-epoxy-1,2-dihydrophenyl)acetyl-CoA isomerase|nr:2-(1,2-epoxy,2-dihydrophenyl)acetyl-CoA isomerase [Actinomycetota bacterium]
MSSTDTWACLDRTGPVATITLQAPTGPSRINVDSAREWLAALREADADPEVRVIVNRAEGPVWSAGGDLPAFRDHGEEAHDFVREIGSWINAVVALLYESSKLTVASVHGAVAGGGLGAMLACDLVIASKETAFTLGYAKLATNPDAGVSWFLPRIVGYRKALELYLTSQRLSATEALDLGLINYVVPPEELTSATGNLVEELALLAPNAVASTKQLLQASESSTLERHADAEIRAFADNTRSSTFAEGVAAFLKK